MKKEELDKLILDHGDKCIRIEGWVDLVISLDDFVYILKREILKELKNDQTK